MSGKLYTLDEEFSPEFESETSQNQMGDFLVDAPVSVTSLEVGDLNLAPERDMEEIFIEDTEVPLIHSINEIESDIIEMTFTGDFIKIIENPEIAPKFYQQYLLAKDKAPELCLYEILPFKMKENFIIEDRDPIFRGDSSYNSKQVSDLLNKLGLKISSSPKTRIGDKVLSLITKTDVKPFGEEKSAMPVSPEEEIFDLDDNNYLSDINNITEDEVDFDYPSIEEDPFI